MHFVTAIYTMFQGKRVGTDAYGNVYYEARKDKTAHGHKKRWVVYKGKAEPTKVPAIWHGWLHYTTNLLPTNSTQPHHTWEKSHLPNLTGTTLAYFPPGDTRSGGNRDKSASDYEAWVP